MARPALRLMLWLPALLVVAAMVRWGGTAGLTLPIVLPWHYDPLAVVWLFLITLALPSLQLPWLPSVFSVLVAAVLMVLIALSTVPPVVLIVVGMIGLVLGLWGARPATLRMALAQLVRPLTIYGLLRLLQVGPWPLWCGLTLTLVGGALALGGAVALLRPRPARQGFSLSLFGAVLGCVGLTSPLGLAAALWLLCVLALVGAQDMPTAPLPFGGVFVGWWFAVAAAVASANAVLLACFALAVLATGGAVVRWPVQADAGPLGPAVLGSAGLLVGLLTQRFVQPVIDLLAIGLTQLGLLESRPWIGVAALNAGHQRVLLLPGVVWIAVAVVIGAVSILFPRGDHTVAPTLVQNERTQVWNSLLQRVWWLRRG